MQLPQRVFSGVQPTGALHLGNYLGAIARFVPLQDSFECLYCVVDLHAITVPQDPKKLGHAVRGVAAAYLAAGVDPERSIIFSQSQVCAHAELAWILSCVARMGWLGRMTQFKEKAGKDRENASVGLFTYPILMAADILAYQATHVPVGEDQKQHLELARAIAQKFNHDFQARLQELGKGRLLSEEGGGREEEGSQTGRRVFFPLPEPLIMGPATRIMSLRDGQKKMSKSDPSDMSRIGLMDSPEVIQKKIQKAKTDAAPLPATEEELQNRPEAANLVGIYAALSGQSPAQVLQEYAGAPFSIFKPHLAACLIEKLHPLSEEMRRLLADPAELDRLLGRGAEKAGACAEKVMREIYTILGFASKNTSA